MARRGTILLTIISLLIRQLSLRCVRGIAERTAPGPFTYSRINADEGCGRARGDSLLVTFLAHRDNDDHTNKLINVTKIAPEPFSGWWPPQFFDYVRNGGLSSSFSLPSANFVKDDIKISSLKAPLLFKERWPPLFFNWLYEITSYEDGFKFAVPSSGELP